MTVSKVSDAVERSPAMAPRTDPPAKTETFIKEEEMLKAERRVGWHLMAGGT